MEKFIPGMYEATDIPGRYTYTGGSTTGGAIPVSYTHLDVYKRQSYSNVALGELVSVSQLPIAL